MAGQVSGAIAGGLGGVLGSLEENLKNPEKKWSKILEEAIEGGLKGSIQGALTGGLMARLTYMKPKPKSQKLDEGDAGKFASSKGSPNAPHDPQPLVSKEGVSPPHPNEPRSLGRQILDKVVGEKLIHGVVGKLDPTGKLYGALKSFAKKVNIEACFAKGSKIYAWGTWGIGWREIELITTDDWVLSRNEHDPNGLVEWKRVEETFERLGRVWNLDVEGKRIKTTGEHPFFEQVKDWTNAQDLRIGDKLLTREGTWQIVTNIEDTNTYETVYNLRVADWHTYFVGDDNWGWGLWAHNSYDEWLNERYKEWTGRNGLNPATNGLKEIFTNIVEGEYTDTKGYNRVKNHLKSVLEGKNDQEVHDLWYVANEWRKNESKLAKALDAVVPAPDSLHALIELIRSSYEKGDGAHPHPVGNGQKVVGNGQTTGSTNPKFANTLHFDAMLRLAALILRNGVGVDTVFLGKSLVDVLKHLKAMAPEGRPSDAVLTEAINATQKIPKNTGVKPDLVVLRNENGVWKLDIYEVVSELSQTELGLRTVIAKQMQRLPRSLRSDSFNAYTPETILKHTNWPFLGNQ